MLVHDNLTQRFQNMQLKIVQIIDQFLQSHEVYLHLALLISDIVSLLALTAMANNAG